MNIVKKIRKAMEENNEVQYIKLIEKLLEEGGKTEQMLIVNKKDFNRAFKKIKKRWNAI